MEKLDSAQLDQLKEIGAYLQQVRQEQSKSLEEIATKTCIRLPLLRAIEQGQEQVLPEPVFIQGFIRRYADVLGLDGADISRLFPVHTSFGSRETHSEDRAETGRASRRIEAIEPVQSFPSRSEFSSSLESPLRSKPAYLLYAILGLAALGALVATVVRPNLPAQDSAEKPKQSPRASTPLSPSAVPQVSPASPVASASPLLASPSLSSAPANAAGAPVMINVRLIGRSWIQVTADGEVEYEGILDQGTQRSWSAQKAITVVAGDAGAVSVALNNGSAQPMGRSGDVKEMTFAPKSR